MKDRKTAKKQNIKQIKSPLRKFVILLTAFVLLIIASLVFVYFSLSSLFHPAIKDNSWK